MSSAARETSRLPVLPPLTTKAALAGADLPAISPVSIGIREADPDPAPGTERDALAALGEARILRHEADMAAALEGYLDRVLGVIVARAGGPKARKGTRFAREATQEKVRFTPAGPVAATLEHKAMSATYVAPDRMAVEIREVVRPVAQRIVDDAVVDAGRRMGREIGIAAFDQRVIDEAIEDAIRRMVNVSERHIAEIRKTITDADATAADLDALLDRIRQAHRRGAHWVKLSGRTLAVALGNDAALAAARALGVTHAQWISRRDERVRPTHRAADGQVRPIGERYRVGLRRLLYPGDPSGLPGSWDEIAGCRCHLAFLPPSQDFDELFDAAGAPGEIPTGAARQLVASAAQLAGAGATVGVLRTEAAGVPPVVPALKTPGPVVAYRVLDGLPDVQPGQWVTYPDGWVLSLVRPAAGAVLRVAIPAGATVGVAGAALVLPAGQALSVLAVDAEGVAATLP